MTFSLTIFDVQPPYILLALFSCFTKRVFVRAPVCASSSFMALSYNSTQAHVLAVPLAAQGHLNPLMRFCKLLASQGVLVTFVNIDAVHHRLKELKQDAEEDDNELAIANKQNGAGQYNIGHSQHHVENIRSAHIPIQGFDPAHDFRFSLENFFEALVHGTGPPLEALIHQLNQKGPPITCVISDFYMTFPTQHVAHKLNIPWVVFFTSSASLLLLFHYVSTQGERTPKLTEVLESLARREECREVICHGLSGLPTIYNNEAPHYKHVVDATLYMWEYATKACGEPFRDARALVINSFENLEAPALMALSKQMSFPIYEVGPLVQPLHKDSSTSLWKEDEACILWLDQQPPLSVLYISFGSTTILSQHQLREIVEGLLSSEQRFLWVFRPDLMGSSTEYSSSFVCDDVLSRSHGRGYVVDWAPQLRVLSHPSVGGFLTHCGWNSTTEAIAHGVPMLCWPYFADQMLDAKYVVEEWKVGLKFEASCCKEGGANNYCLQVERGEVERVIRCLLEGDEGKLLRKNASCLKEAASQSLPPNEGNDIQSLLQSFII